MAAGAPSLKVLPTQLAVTQRTHESKDLAMLGAGDGCQRGAADGAVVLGMGPLLRVLVAVDIGQLVVSKECPPTFGPCVPARATPSISMPEYSEMPELIKHTLGGK